MNLPCLAKFREEIGAVHSLIDRGLGELGKDKPN